MRKLTKEERAARMRAEMRDKPLFLFDRCKWWVEQQDAREGPLVEALRKLAVLGNGNMPGNSEGNVIAQHALAAWDGLDAAPEPTLLEAAKALVAPMNGTREHQLVPVALFDALKAAVEREERAK